MDTPLEDVIKQEQSKRRGRGGRGRARSARRQKQQAGGVAKRSSAALSTQIAPQSAFGATQPPAVWQHDLYEAATGNSSNKVLVSNLHHDVTNQELEQIFQLIAPIRRAEVNFDFTGRSKGTAEVVFTNSSDAQRASREYNGQMCKGLPIRIDVVAPPDTPAVRGAATTSAATAAPATNGVSAQTAPAGRRRSRNRRTLTVTRKLPNTGTRGRGGRRSRGRGGGRGAPKEDQSKSAADLDAELDQYMQE